jgi:lysophospholipase L1-like esterase
MPTTLQTGHTLLCIGDSITDGDRRDLAFAPLGRGYVRLLHDLLILREPAKAITVLNRGIGGNTADDLRSRWHEDALLHRPDALVLKIGINDLNQFLCQPEKPHVAPDAYSKIHDNLLARARAALPAARLVVLSPFLLSTDADPDSYRARVLRTLPAYIEPARANAARHGARFVDLHALFQERLRHRHPDLYCPEPVHPNATGHLVIADAVYQALCA